MKNTEKLTDKSKITYNNKRKEPEADDHELALSLSIECPRSVRPKHSQEDSKTIVSPFPWATDGKARVHSLDYLHQNGITVVTGNVRCKKCEVEYEMEFNVMEKFKEFRRFVNQKKNTMHDRAPKEWIEPVLPGCKHCGLENSARPIIEVDGQCEINWLFLFLGQLLGLCTLEQLKYFCKHTTIHRTAAKDRLIYVAYKQLYEQLYGAVW